MKWKWGGQILISKRKETKGSYEREDGKLRDRIHVFDFSDDIPSYFDRVSNGILFSIVSAGSMRGYVRR